MEVLETRTDVGINFGFVMAFGEALLCRTSREMFE